ncbi:MAG: carboxypeptidase regulatory-like domain-containing protein, partial [Gemmatimonadota bacterium]
MSNRTNNRWTVIAALVLCPLMAGVRTVAAQGVTVGGLTIAVVDDHGSPVQEATVTLERGGATVRTLTASRSGLVSIAVLSPGRYAVLAEQFGYQPVRMREVEVVGGGVTRVTLRLARRHPPVTSVEEQPSNAMISGASQGQGITGRNLTAFAARNDIGGALAASSSADLPRDGRYDALASGNGLRPAFSSLFVDGVHETLLRHPGVPSEGAAPYLFARDGVTGVSFSGLGPNGSTPGTLGSIISAETVRGGGRFSFRPWATFSSAKLGGKSLDNPGDSSASSIQAGVAMSGAIKGDTASWFLRADYQQLQQPGASPFDAARATSDTAADLPGAFRTAAGSKEISSWLAPTVRTWKGGSGAGRLDWRFGASTLFALRANAASWTETNPQVGTELVNGAGSQLKATDISVAAELTAGADAWTSETRIGVRSATRDWTGASLPYTGIVGDALAFGSAVTLPGHFKENGFGAAESVVYRVGDHTLQGGLSFDHRAVTDDWLPGSAGVFQFGNLAGFSAARGSFYQAIRTGAAPNLSASDLGIFVQDEWRITPQLQLLFGMRLDYEGLPSGVVTENTGWERVAGFRNTLLPKDVRKQDFAPRAGITWDVSGDGQTVVRGLAAVVPGQFDLAALSEAAQYDGDVTIRRATGTLSWAQVGASAGTAAGQALTLFADSVRKPKSFKSELSITQRLGGGTTVTVGGAYRHADYLLQRQDMNLAAGTLATGSDGRPVFGAIQQYGALLTPAVGSNRRFSEFDMVYALTGTGYNDYYEASLSLEHRMSRGVDLVVGYTYSKTTDNLPGSLSANPADQLSPFPSGLNGARWEDGRSDLDIPHRVSATLSYTGTAKYPLTLAARFRYRSGLPFTPGFRNGVDANGDGSGANDPAFVGASISGMS